MYIPGIRGWFHLQVDDLYYMRSPFFRNRATAALGFLGMGFIVLKNRSEDVI